MNGSTPHVDFESPPPDPSGPWAALVYRVESDVYTSPPPRREWLLRDARHAKARGVFQFRDTGQLIAEGGAGKTMAVFQLAVAVATGTPWLGAFGIGTPGRVLVIVGEEDRAECERRLYHAAQVAKCCPESGAIEVLPLRGVAAPMIETDDAGNLVDGPFTLWLREYVDAGQFVLVIVDPLSRFGGKEAEVLNAAGTRFVQSLESIATAAGASVLNCHHTNQSSRGNGAVVNAISGRGVTALVDGPRWQASLSVEYLEFDSPEQAERLGEIVTFKVTKSNYAAKAPPVLLRRDSEHQGALVPLDDDDLKLVEAVRSGSGEREAKDDAKAERASLKMQADERGALWVVMKQPGLNASELIVEVKRELKCGEKRASSAIQGIRKYLAIVDGKNKAKKHNPPASADGLPAHLRAEFTGGKA